MRVPVTGDTEDLGTTPRRKLSTRDRLKVFEAHGGVCALCGAKIDGTRDKWIVEHLRALGLGGTDDDSNMAPAHERCASAKTADDIPRIAKAKRVKARHIGARAPSRNPMPGSRNTPFRRKINGTTEWRDHE